MRISRKGCALGYTIALAGVALCLALAARATAQDSPPDSAAADKVAVIDVQRLVFESKAGKEVLETLKNLSEQKRAEAEALQQEIEDLRERIARGRMSLSEDRLSEMEKQLEDKLIAYQRFEDDAEREMEEEKQAAFSRIENQMMPIITQIGQEFEYTLIFNKFNSGLLFALDEADITDLILERFDDSRQDEG
jgi:outer membrane protein